MAAPQDSSRASSTTLSTVKRGIVILTGIVLVVGIALGLPTAIALQKSTNVTVVKRWFTTADLYEDVAVIGLQATLESFSENLVGIPTVNAPRVLVAYREQFPVAAARTALESVLDSLFRWGHHDTERLTFDADFAPVDQFLQTQALAIVQNQLSELPRCSPTEAVTGLCLPESVDQAVFNQAIEQYWQAQVMLDDALQADLTRITETNGEELLWLRQWFDFAGLFNRWFALGMAIASGLFVWASAARTRGLGRLMILWAVGSGLAIVTWLIVRVVLLFSISAADLSADTALSSQLFFDLLVELFKIAHTDVLSHLIWLGIVGIALGIAGRLVMQSDLAPLR